MLFSGVFRLVPEFGVERATAPGGPAVGRLIRTVRRRRLSHRRHAGSLCKPKVAKYALFLLFAPVPVSGAFAKLAWRD